MHTQILDHWTVCPVAPHQAEMSKLAISVAALDPISTKQTAFGTDMSTALPKAMEGALFDGDGSTYAVLDGCKFSDLPGLLERSDLTHQCLFAGNALKDFGEEAPWLVQLEPECSVLRDLFKFGPAPWHLGGKTWGICLRAHGTFEDVRNHLRKFMRYDRDASRGGLFRFYDPQTLDFYLHEASPEALIGLRQGQADVVLKSFLFPRSAEAWFTATLPKPPEGAARVAKLDSDAVERVAMRAAAMRIETRLRKGRRISFEGLPQENVHETMLQALLAFYAAGIKHELFLTHLLGWAITIGPTYWTTIPEIAAHMRATDVPAQQRFQAILSYLKTAFPDRVVPHYV